MMCRIYFIIILISSSIFQYFSVYCQVDSLDNNYETEIAITFDKFMEATENKDVDVVINHMYPKIFEFIPKDILTQILKETAEDTTSNIMLENTKIDSISKKISVSESDYAIVFYSFLMITKMDYDDSDEDSSDIFDAYKFTYDLMVIQYGEENVFYNEKEKKISVQVSNRAIAIKEHKEWYFLEYKENLLPIIEKIIPSEVIVAAKPSPKACKECSSLEDALIDPEQVNSLQMNGYNGENLKSLPSQIGKMKNLKILYLTDHSFTSLPKEIGQLKKLEELSLAGCKLKILPDELFTLNNLRELLLYDNNFSNKYIKKIRKRFEKEMPNTKILLESDF